MVHQVPATLAVAVAVGLLLGAGSASGAFPGRNGLIVYDYEPKPPDYEEHIAVVSPGRVRPHDLTKGSYGDTQPAWSPDGRRIAFNRDDTIWVMNANGSGAREFGYVTPQESQEDSSPAWSPDGKRIALTRIESESDEPVILIEGTTGFTGGTVRGNSPAWSPNGKTIAFTRDRGLFVMSSSGRGVRRLVGTRHGDFKPSWFPDGRRLAYIDGDDVYVIGADGRGKRRVTHSKVGDEEVAVSPSGTMLAVIRGGSIYVMTTEGRGARKIADVAALSLDWQPVR